MQIAVMIGALNGIVMSYHFGFAKDREGQFPYLRRFASDKMTDGMCTMLMGAGVDTATRMLEVQAQLEGIFAAKQAEVTAIVNGQIEGIVKAEGKPFPVAIGVDSDEEDAGETEDAGGGEAARPAGLPQVMSRAAAVPHGGGITLTAGPHQAAALAGMDALADKVRKATYSTCRHCGHPRPRA